MKKNLLILPFFIACFMLMACNNSSANSVSIYDLQTTMLQSDNTLPDMITVNSNTENAGELFQYISDMDYDKVDGFFLGYSSEGLADEVALIRVKSSSDVETAYSSLQKHVEKRVNLYRTYDPTQTSRAESALVFKNGNYAILIISDNASDIKKAFEDGIL